MPRRCPPFTNAAQPNRRLISRAAPRKSSTDRIVLSVIAAASSTLGVINAASGSNSLSSALIAAGFSRRAPLVATMTGSTTNATARLRQKKPATTRIISAELQHPRFHGCGPNSANTASICFRTISRRQARFPPLAWVLRRHTGDRAGAMHTQRRERFQVCLETRPAAAVRTRNRQRHGH